MKKIVNLLILILLSSCSNKTDDNKISSNIYTQLKESQWKIVDFSKAAPFKFEKVCILGPYSSNEGIESTLGFFWDIEKKTDIYSNDGINVIIFVKDNEVISYVEHRRDKGDFSKFSGKCFNYRNSKLSRTSKNSGWTYKE